MVNPRPGTVEVEDRFDEMEVAIEEGLEGYIEAIYEETVNQIVSNMLSGTDAMGRRWPPTEDPDDSVPLVDSGSLAASIARDSRLMESVLTAVFTSDLDYAATHEFGLPSQGIPPRPFLQPGLEYALEITPTVFRDEVDTRVQSVLM